MNQQSKEKTKYFQNCLGVFQGGGCKGIAYVGAFRESVKWGVSYSELVGTSAGSIVAVLIGAGANPEQLEDIMNRLNFIDLLADPIPLFGYEASNLAKAVRFIPIKVIKKYNRILTHLGIHNSDNLRKWLETELQKLLPEAPKPIKFEDLIIPTNVIVTNITTKRVEVFNATKTPKAIVSEIVQASCNIPIFFQPINMKYVDGGLLSNLPSFVFNGQNNKLYNRVLAYSLESAANSNDPNTFSSYLKALVDTLLEGNLDLQLSLQDYLHIIKIKTGSISATDFDKIDDNVKAFLKEQGRICVNDFFANEINNVYSTEKNPNVSYDAFNTSNYLIQTLSYRYEEILIADINSKWVYELFPTILTWKQMGTRITFFVQRQLGDKEHEEFRQRFLKYLGVEVIEVSALPFNAFIFDPNNSDNCRAVVINGDKEAKVYHSKLYNGEQDFHVINSLGITLKSGKAGEVKATKIKLEQVDEFELFSSLRNVREYNTARISMKVANVNIKDIIFLTKYVRGYKFRQIAKLFELYSSFDIPLFEPAKLLLANEKYTIVTPPVIEERAGKYFLIEGNTRFAYAFRNGIENLKCVIVSNVEEQLPSNGKYSAKEILLADKELVGDQRYENWDYKYFRKIEENVRNPLICLL